MANSSESWSEFDFEKWILFLERSVQTENEIIYAIFLIIAIFLCVASFFGNSLVCFIICYEKSMHTTTNYYLLNLAISDLIMTLTMMIESSVKYTEQNGFFLCKLQWFLVVCLWNNSILTMAALAIERYIAIWHPLKLKPTSAWRRVSKIIVLVWLLAIAATLLEMQTVDLVKVHQYTMCFIIPTPWARFLNGVLAIVTFVVPLIIMIFAHSTIVYKVINTQMDNTRDSIFNHEDPRGKISKLVSKYAISFFLWTESTIYYNNANIISSILNDNVININN